MITNTGLAIAYTFQHLLFTFVSDPGAVAKISGGGSTLAVTSGKLPGLRLVLSGTFEENSAGDLTRSDIQSFDILEDSTRLSISVLLPVLVSYLSLATAAGLGSGRFTTKNYLNFFNVLLPIVTTLLILTGSAFDDVGQGFDGTNDEFDYKDGDDRHILGGGDDMANGGPGRDTLDLNDLEGGAKVNLSNGTASHANGTLSHSGFENVIGSTKRDVITGNDAKNRIDTGDGKDKVSTGGGNDKVFSGKGNDTAYGGDGNDVIKGGAGDDRLFGGKGRDTIAGEDGNDVIDGGKGNDRLIGGNGKDNIEGGKGDDDLSGGDGSDFLSGGGGDDTISGGLRSDQLLGGAGDDRLSGGKGNDLLSGGKGDDILTGGKGADTFHFDLWPGEFDRVVDFDPGNDTLDVPDSLIEDLTVRHKKGDTLIEYDDSMGRTSTILLEDLVLTKDDLFDM